MSTRRAPMVLPTQAPWPVMPATRAASRSRGMADIRRSPHLMCRLYDFVHGFDRVPLSGGSYRKLSVRKLMMRIQTFNAPGAVNTRESRRLSRISLAPPRGAAAGHGPRVLRCSPVDLEPRSDANG